MEVAAETFARDGQLPFSQCPATTQGSAEGRRRLSGAFSIDIDRIENDPDQPRKRIDSVYLEELTQSVRHHGILQPISVRYIESAERYRIVAGECRYTAAKKAGLKEIPCWVKSPKENEVLVQQIVENWVRSDLNCFELADSLAILRDSNRWTQTQLARQTGKSQGEISKLLSILDLEPDAQSLARQDTACRVTKRHLYALSRLPSTLQTTVTKRILTQNLTALDVERLADREAKRREAGDKRGTLRTTRSFRTGKVHVLFSTRSESIPDVEILAAIKEIKQQLSGDEC